ncbi:MAG: HDOD domain-containing protein [Methylovulum sp.]|nr:MAG: HDOD domain-containing protein [Methylovulum sp.]
MKKVEPPEIKAEPDSFDEWVNVLSEHKMPIFFNTAQSIHNIMSDDKKGTMELASVILQDPNLTVKLLKMSNSAFYNPSRQKMITVSRAILNLGSEMIREITLLCSFFESIRSSANKERATEEIAQAIHAALQAKALAVAVHDVSPEEIFIATLLNPIGKISFWCYCREQGERIQALVKQGAKTREEAEKTVLGFKLSDLCAPLSKAWKLGGLIEEAIERFPSSRNPRVELVHLGYEINEALREGSGSKKYAACIKKIEMLTKQPEKTVIEHIRQHTKLASDIVRQLGAGGALTFAEYDLNLEPLEPEAPPIIDKRQLQFQISQEITTIINDKLDINLLLETVLEGIKRGIGMDRVMFALLSPDKQALYEKLSIGWRKDVSNKIVFNVFSTPPNLFFQALAGSRAFWFKPLTDAGLYTLHDINVIGRTECFIMPIFANNKPTGIVYADRGIGNQALTDEEFNFFKYFTQQANIGLSIYRMQKMA